VSALLTLEQSADRLQHGVRNVGVL
jgi:hypothetical protein